MARKVFGGRLAAGLLASSLIVASGSAASAGGNLEFVEPCSSECTHDSGIAKIDLVGSENCTLTSSTRRLLPTLRETGVASAAVSRSHPCYRQHLEFEVHPGRRAGFKNIPSGSYRVGLTRLDATGNVLGRKTTTNLSVSAGSTTTLATTSLETVVFGLELTNSDGSDAWLQNTGECYEITVKDYGTQTPFSSTLQVHFSATEGSFYSDASCSTSTCCATIADNSSSATAYFQATSPGSVTLTAKASKDDEPVETTAGAFVSNVAQLGFSPDDLTQAVGTCGALEVVAQNSSGQTVTVDSEVGTLDVSLSTSSSTGAFYSDSACASATDSVSIPVGSSSASVYYRDTAVQSFIFFQATAVFFLVESGDTYFLMGTGSATITSSASQ